MINTQETVANMHATHTVELNGPALKAEAEKSHEFYTIVYYGASRDRNREITDIEQMRKGIELRHKEELNPKSWSAAFKKLEEMGMGALIMGRRGNPNRFRWNYSLKVIGQAAMKGEYLTAHRIVHRVKGDKVVNDYYSSKASFAEITIKGMDDGSKTVKTTKITSPVRVTKQDKPVEDTDEPILKGPTAFSPAAAMHASEAASKNIIYVALREDFVFEAEMPALTQKEADVLIAAIKRCVK